MDDDDRCVLCEMMALQRESAPPPLPDGFDHWIEELWISAYIRGIGDALTSYSFEWTPGMCARHSGTLTRWIARYLETVRDGERYSPHELAKQIGVLFNCELSWERTAPGDGIEPPSSALNSKDFVATMVEIGAQRIAADA